MILNVVIYLHSINQKFMSKEQEKPWFWFSTHAFSSLDSVIACGVLARFRDPDSHSISLSISLLSSGGSESSWDKEKLQSPPSSGAHGLAHAGLSAQHGLSGSHLSSLQQSHLLANRESFIHHIHSFTWSPAPGVLIPLRRLSYTSC